MPPFLTDAGVSVIVDATAARRAWREAARALIPCFAEIQLLCPTEVCLERERAVRWGLTFEAAAPAPAPAKPDIVFDYEEAARPDLAIRTDVYDAHAAAERVLSMIRQLAGSERWAEAARLNRHASASWWWMTGPSRPTSGRSAEGYEVVAATSRATGLASGLPTCPISSSRISACGRRWLHVVRRSRRARPGPVIVVTGYPSDETRRAAFAAGATTFLAKPFAAAVLLAAIRSSVDGTQETAT
jgi:CheY-like chemotaxis protein